LKPARANPWPGRVFLDVGSILYVGPGGTAEQHAHQAVQLVWCQGDRPLTVTVGGKSIRRTAVLVAAREAHALDSTGSTVALLLLEAHSARGAAIDRLSRREHGRELSTELAAIVEFPLPALTLAQASTWCERLTRSLSGGAERVEVSSTSRRAIDFIEEHLEGVPSVSAAAARIGISPTRLTHVFSKEVGVPFRRFVLWTRIKRAVTAYQRGGDLTSAAYAAGFSDAAHFSRTFRAMFGLSPSLVLSTAQISGTIWSDLE